MIGGGLVILAVGSTGLYFCFLAIRHDIESEGGPGRLRDFVRPSKCRHMIRSLRASNFGLGGLLNLTVAVVATAAGSMSVVIGILTELE